eukprot:CAMPEP_0170536754 /NCGR_PEP_ID=MMETSP0209-20121228/102323_1 /TAXON_ID=665100 ORGANISM="Litonotus pictus, Strain P1" /NCGR_SAMPLE_ID=MMETSP0209 /ASSEMBLY_ACC=CAM_ASM_000301 /LENGTH=1905 /DNA_ID=CAMNT_0010838155 /DNA_START=1313 /DNA_END=7029 /DNA_ORIENTATION=-
MKNIDSALGNFPQTNDSKGYPSREILKVMTGKLKVFNLVNTLTINNDQKQPNEFLMNFVSTLKEEEKEVYEELKGFLSFDYYRLKNESKQLDTFIETLALLTNSSSGLLNIENAKPVIKDVSMDLINQNSSESREESRNVIIIDSNEEAHTTHKHDSNRNSLVYRDSYGYVHGCRTKRNAIGMNEQNSNSEMLSINEMNSSNISNNIPNDNSLNLYNRGSTISSVVNLIGRQNSNHPNTVKYEVDNRNLNSEEALLDNPKLKTNMVNMKLVNANERNSFPHVNQYNVNFINTLIVSNDPQDTNTKNSQSPDSNQNCLDFHTGNISPPNFTDKNTSTANFYNNNSKNNTESMRNSETKTTNAYNKSMFPMINANDSDKLSHIKVNNPSSGSKKITKQISFNPNPLNPSLSKRNSKTSTLNIYKQKTSFNSINKNRFNIENNYKFFDYDFSKDNELNLVNVILDCSKKSKLLDSLFLDFCEFLKVNSQKKAQFLVNIWNSKFQIMRYLVLNFRNLFETAFYSKESLTEGYLKMKKDYVETQQSYDIRSHILDKLEKSVLEKNEHIALLVNQLSKANEEIERLNKEMDTMSKKHNDTVVALSKRIGRAKVDSSENINLVTVNDEDMEKMKFNLEIENLIKLHQKRFTLYEKNRASESVKREVLQGNAKNKNLIAIKNSTVMSIHNFTSENNSQSVSHLRNNTISSKTESDSSSRDNSEKDEAESKLESNSSLGTLNQNTLVLNRFKNKYNIKINTVKKTEPIESILEEKEKEKEEEKPYLDNDKQGTLSSLREEKESKLSETSKKLSPIKNTPSPYHLNPNSIRTVSYNSKSSGNKLDKILQGRLMMNPIPEEDLDMSKRENSQFIGEDKRNSIKEVLEKANNSASKVFKSFKRQASKSLMTSPERKKLDRKVDVLSSRRGSRMLLPHSNLNLYANKGFDLNKKEMVDVETQTDMNLVKQDKGSLSFISGVEIKSEELKYKFTKIEESLKDAIKTVDNPFLKKAVTITSEAANNYNKITDTLNRILNECDIIYKENEKLSEKLENSEEKLENTVETYNEVFSIMTSAMDNKNFDSDMVIVQNFALKADIKVLMSKIINQHKYNSELEIKLQKLKESLSQYQKSENLVKEVDQLLNHKKKYNEFTMAVETYNEVFSIMTSAMDNKNFDSDMVIVQNFALKADIKVLMSKIINQHKYNSELEIKLQKLKESLSQYQKSENLVKEVDQLLNHKKKYNRVHHGINLENNKKVEIDKMKKSFKDINIEYLSISAKIKVTLSLKKTLKIINTILFETVEQVFFKKDKVNLTDVEQNIYFEEVLRVYFINNFGLETLAKKKYLEFIKALELYKYEHKRIGLFMRMVNVDFERERDRERKSTVVEGDKVKELKGYMRENTKKKKLQFNSSYNLEGSQAKFNSKNSIDTPLARNITKNNQMKTISKKNLYSLNSQIIYNSEKYDNFVIRQICIVIQMLKNSRCVIKSSPNSEDTSNNIYLSHSKMIEVIRNLQEKFKMNSQMRTNMDEFMDSSKHYYNIDMRNFYVIDFDRFIEFLSEILSEIVKIFSVDLVSVFKAVDIEEKGYLNYFDFLLCFQYLFKPGYSENTIKSMWKHFSEGNAEETSLVSSSSVKRVNEVSGNNENNELNEDSFNNSEPSINQYSAETNNLVNLKSKYNRNNTNNTVYLKNNLNHNTIDKKNTLFDSSDSKNQYNSHEKLVQNINDIIGNKGILSYESLEVLCIEKDLFDKMCFFEFLKMDEEQIYSTVQSFMVNIQSGGFLSFENLKKRLSNIKTAHNYYPLVATKIDRLKNLLFKESVVSKKDSLIYWTAIRLLDELTLEISVSIRLKSIFEDLNPILKTLDILNQDGKENKDSKEPKPGKNQLINTSVKVSTNLIVRFIDNKDETDGEEENLEENKE